MSEIIRCPWGNVPDELMREYHDTQWGKPCRGERTLFEMLILEGAQAGLSWSCILHKRENYRVAFDDWYIAKIAAYDEGKIAELLQNSGIVRNKLKVNAQAVLKLRFGSLSDFIWGYVDGNPIVNHWREQSEMPATTPLSDKISNRREAGKRRRGMSLKTASKRALPLILAALMLALSACCNRNKADPPQTPPVNAVTERWLSDSDATYSAELSADNAAVSQSGNIIQVGKTADGADVYALEHFTIEPMFLVDEVSEARLFLKLVSGETPKSLTITPMLGAWDGYFDARSMVDALIDKGSAVTADVQTEADGWVSVSVTPIAKTWLDGGLQNNGFAVFGAVNGETHNFASFYDEDNKPYIAVTGAVGDRPLAYGKFGYTQTPLPGAEDMGGNCMSYALRDTNMILGEDMEFDPAALKSAYEAGGEDAIADYVTERVLTYVEAHKEGFAISKLRRIDRYDAPIDAKTEYRIAMRVGVVGHGEYEPDFYDKRAFDYHFWLQLNDGRWAQKYPTGDSLIVPCSAADIDPGKYPWSAGYNWSFKNRDYYTSKTVYFAVTKDIDEFTRHRGEIRDRNFDEDEASAAFSFQAVVAERLPSYTFDVIETPTNGAYTYTINISNIVGTILQEVVEASLKRLRFSSL